MTRIKHALRKVERAEQALDQARSEFRDEIQYALEHGETLSSVGRLLGVTRQRVAAIAKRRRSGR